MLGLLCTDLLPNTEYLVNVVALHEERESSPLRGTMKTGTAYGEGLWSLSISSVSNPPPPPSCGLPHQPGLL